MRNHTSSNVETKGNNVVANDKSLLALATELIDNIQEYPAQHRLVAVNAMLIEIANNSSLAAEIDRQIGKRLADVPLFTIC